mmetsp:Transcript_3515/g.7257  ORF Transcript_3515/g.7257 Transcript_3515/m.7257 type:complete len:209 (-) Transcript_3515:165-791(-)
MGVLGLPFVPRCIIGTPAQHIIVFLVLAWLFQSQIGLPTPPQPGYVRIDRRVGIVTFAGTRRIQQGTMRMNRNDFAAQSTKAFLARHQRQIGTGGIPRQVQGGSILQKFYHAQSFHDGPGKRILGGQRIVHRDRNDVFGVGQCRIASGFDHPNGFFDTQHVIGLADDHSATVELNHDRDVWRQSLPVDGIKVYRNTSGGCVCLQRVGL